MRQAICIECGRYGDVHAHHVFGRKQDPKTVVDLCPSCHEEYHRGFLLWKNRASSNAMDWLDQERAVRYVGVSEFHDKLQSLGYVPEWDGWEDRDDEVYNLIVKNFPEASAIYLNNLRYEQ